MAALDHTKDSEIIAGRAVATDHDPATVVSEEDSETKIAEVACDPATAGDPAGEVHELDKLALECGSDGIDLLAKRMQVDAHDWHNRLRGAVLGLLSDLPLGGAISTLVGLFWPATRVNIWEALGMEAYVTNIVRKEIFEFEMRQHESDIEALERSILRYERGLLTEKATALGIWIAQADALSIRLGNSTNRIHLLLHIVTVAVLHMAALHERLTFGEEIYGANNTANWTKELEETFQRYTSDRIPVILKTFRMHPTRSDIMLGTRVLQVNVRAGTLLESIQFVYYHPSSPNGIPNWGNIAGNPRGGESFVVDVRTRHIQDLRLEFSRDVLVSLQIRFEDGTSTQKFGNATGWATSAVTCTAPSGYTLNSWDFREDPGPNGTTAISVAGYGFTPDDIRLPPA
nr:insecticidal protein IPD113 [Doodia media]